MEKKYEFEDLCFTKRPHFSGYESNLDDSKYVLVGVPHDMTCCYRPGTRNGPSAIREASINIETYSNFSEKDLSEVRIHDIGDIILLGSHRDRLDQVKVVLKQIKEWNKIPIMLGGEHSISIPIRDLYDSKTLFLIIDAHGDLRDEYLDERFSHACTTKRLLDTIKAEQIIQMGIRAQSIEEIEFLSTIPDLTQISSYDIQSNGVLWAVNSIKEKIISFDSVYISVDIDGFDPAFAPGTGTPEPMGLSPYQVFTLIHELVPNDKIVGIDLVEVNPIYDHGGITSILAAKTLFEILLTN